MHTHLSCCPAHHSTYPDLVPLFDAGLAGRTDVLIHRQDNFGRYRQIFRREICRILVMRHFDTAAVGQTAQPLQHMRPFFLNDFYKLHLLMYFIL